MPQLHELPRPSSADNLYYAALRGAMYELTNDAIADFFGAQSLHIRRTLFTLYTDLVQNKGTTAAILADCQFAGRLDELIRIKNTRPETRSPSYVSYINRHMSVPKQMPPIMSPEFIRCFTFSIMAA
jgi:hypothetical protein